MRMSWKRSLAEAYVIFILTSHQIFCCLRHLAFQIRAQAAQVHYVWVRFGRNILELLVYYLMPTKCKNLKDMKSSCLSICISSL